MTTFGTVNDAQDTVISNTEWVKIENGKQRFVILSHCSPDNVSKTSDDWEFGRDMLQYRRVEQWINNKESQEGGKFGFKFPVTGPDVYDENENQNPYINVADSLGIDNEYVKDAYLMWVADADADEIVPMLWDVKPSIKTQLVAIEKNLADQANKKDRKTLRGHIVSVTRSGKGLQTKYEAMIEFRDAVDLSEVEYPKSLVDAVYPLQTDKQIEYVNSHKASVMSWLNLSEDQYPFTQDGKIKPEFTEQESGLEL